MASVLTYGSLVHQDNEANLVGVSKRTQFSPRARKIQQVIDWDIQVEIQATTVAGIISRIQTLEAAYSQDGGTATYSIDGSIAHRLTGDSSSGVRVVYAGFPRGDGAELATKRTFAVKLRATYDASGQPGGDDLVAWQESISIEGDGGPLIIVAVEYPGVQTVGGLSAVQLAPRTAQYYTQTGSAVGYSTYPIPPGPFNPEGEFGYLRRIQYISGRQIGNGIRFFTTKWYYRMGRDLFLYGSIDPRPTSK